MRLTNPSEKACNSLINVLFVLLISSPLWYASFSPILKKMIVLLLFFVYKLVIIFFNKNRSLGMLVTNTYWKKKYPLNQQIFHSVLYTSSFSTLLFWIYFPFDLFLFNMLFFQIPTLYFKKTTFHGYIAGNMVTIKKLRKIKN